MRLALNKENTRLTGFVLLFLANVQIGTAATSELELAPALMQEIEIPVNKARMLDLNRDISLVTIGQKEIADFRLITKTNQLWIQGKRLGTTNMVLVDQTGKRHETINITVTHDLETLKANLHALFPHDRPAVYSSQDHIVLAGEVSSLVKANAIARLAASFAPDGKLINLMQIGGSQQVMLEVKVAELSRSVLKRFGINMAAIRPGFSNTRLGLINGGASFPDARFEPDGARIPILGTNGSQNPTGPAIQELAPSTPAISATGLFLSFLKPDFVLNLVVDAAKQNGLAKVLAEPTLTALSGQDAEFLSGGEFPVPVQTDDGISVSYKQFGIGLKFVPIVLDSGRISLKLNLQVSELSNATGVAVGVSNTSNVVSVPALSTRSVKSTVEVGVGETIGIAGLISENLREAVQKFPGLGDVPILGQLFRSQEFQNDQSELVVFVTPRLAQTIETASAATPTGSFVAPSDYDFYIMGKSNDDLQRPVTPQAARIDHINEQFGHGLGGGKPAQ